MITRWEKLTAAQRMVAHIEANLNAPITLSALARAARYSQWHAARMFKECTGRTPFEYIRMRRLSAAAERLAGGGTPVLDVALDFVFDSHDGFTRAFSRQFGLTPSEYRRTKPRLDLFPPIDVRDAYAARQRGERPMPASPSTPPHTVFVQVVERPARKLLLRRARQARHYFEYCEEVGCEVWDQLGAVPEALGEPMGLWLPERLRPDGTSVYVQGIEVPLDFRGEIPEGFDLVTLDPCRLMVFQGPPFEDARFEAAIDAVWEAINAYCPESLGYRWADEDAPRYQLAPFGYRGYIEGRPVRSL